MPLRHIEWFKSLFFGQYIISLCIYLSLTRHIAQLQITIILYSSIAKISSIILKVLRQLVGFCLLWLSPILNNISSVNLVLQFYKAAETNSSAIMTQVFEFQAKLIILIFQTFCILKARPTNTYIFIPEKKIKLHAHLIFSIFFQFEQLLHFIS